MSAHLDNPIWNALTTLQGPFGERRGDTARFFPQVTALAGLGKLRHLMLNDTAVTGASVRVFDGLKKLEVLYLKGTAVTAGEIEGLCERHPELTVFPMPRSVLEKRVRERRKR